MNPSRFQRVCEVALVVGAPLLLALVEVVHPHPHDLLNIDLRMWIIVHYAQVPLFPLSALAVTALVRGQAGFVAGVCRVATFVFAVGYVAFDTAAGVVTGILVDAARKSGAPETWRVAIDAVWMHPIMGGSPLLAPPPLLAVLGSVALSVGAVAAAFSLKRSGTSWGPVLLLALSSFGIGIFRTHAWPGGPLTFGGIGIAAAWVLWERARLAKTRPAGAVQ